MYFSEPRFLCRGCGSARSVTHRVRARRNITSRADRIPVPGCSTLSGMQRWGGNNRMTRFLARRLLNYIVLLAAGIVPDRSP